MNVLLWDGERDESRLRAENDRLRDELARYKAFVAAWDTEQDAQRSWESRGTQQAFERAFGRAKALHKARAALPNDEGE